MAAIEALLDGAQKPLAGKKVRGDFSGPTHEPIDSLRLHRPNRLRRKGRANAIAAALNRLGADVPLISWSCELPDPARRDDDPALETRAR